MAEHIRRLLEYSENHTKRPSEALEKIERETHLKTVAPQMISGHLQGRFLSLISKLVRPKLILEIGTFTGYSSICMAEGLEPGGMIHTIEHNIEMKPLLEVHLKQSGYENSIQVHYGEALKILPQLKGPFDLVFIDASKIEYRQYYESVMPKVSSGGVILADNTLWSGKVIEDEKDEETLAIDSFNKMVLADERVDNILLPIRDGIMVARKK
jgi:caffeoyl-CoA O-methyltransferase